MTNYKRKKRRGASTCGLCKPHKKPGCKKPRNKRITFDEYWVGEIKNCIIGYWPPEDADLIKAWMRQAWDDARK